MNSIEVAARASAKKMIKIWVPVFVLFWFVGLFLDGVAHIDDTDARRSFTAVQYLIVYIFLVLLFAYVSYTRTFLNLTKNKKLAKEIALKLKAIKALNMSLLFFSAIWLANLFILKPSSEGTFVGHLYWTHLLKEAGLFVVLSIAISRITYTRSKCSA